MKFTKKMFTMLMAVVMMMAMATTAFAAETANIAVSATNPSTGVTITFDFDSVAGQTLQAALNATSYNPQWKQVTNWNDPDVPAYALEALTINGVTYATAAGTLADVENKGFEDATAVAGHPGYFEADDSVEGAYHYIYAGWDWTYGYANSTTPIYDYMSQFTLEAGQELVLTYSLSVTDWTTDKPIE